MMSRRRSKGGSKGVNLGGADLSFGTAGYSTSGVWQEARATPIAASAR
jgi:hypothetical protein